MGGGGGRTGHRTGAHAYSPLGGIQSSFTSDLARAKQLMVKAEKKIPSHINDHGSKHIERVEKQGRRLEKISKETGLEQKFLGGEKWTPQDEKIQKLALATHDIGLLKGSLEKHQENGARMILESKDFSLTKAERARLARIVKYHNELSLGGESYDLNKWVAQGKISRKDAYILSNLRAADALDAGKPRAQYNSQHQKASEVKKANITTFGPQKGAQFNSHFDGHTSFNQPLLKKGPGGMVVSIRLQDSKIGSHGAQMFRSLFRKMNSTLYRDHYSINFQCKNAQKCREWLNKNQGILRSELKGKKISIEEV